jgi:Cu(I)/Ag(I) efflux system membrane fusion protein
MTRKRLVPTIFLGALTVLALIFHARLIAWFTGEPMGGGARSKPVAAQAGPYKAELSLAPDPTRQENNRAFLRITENDKPVAGATVKLELVMPAMGAMSEMRTGAAVRETGNGRYEATFDVAMGGSWTIELSISAAGRPGAARYSFTLGRKGVAAVSGGTAAPSSAAAKPAVAEGPTLPAQQLPPEALVALRAGLDSYDRVRGALANDRVAGIAVDARALGDALKAATHALANAHSEVTDCLATASTATEALATATTLEAARKAFADVSGYVLALAASDPRLQDGWHRFDCPMATGFGGWMQRDPAPANPYMGTKMQSCGNAASWQPPVQLGSGAVSHEGHGHGSDDAAYYTCAMHPSVRASEPGSCPICSMKLSAVTYEQQESGTIVVPEARRGALGIRTAKVTNAPMKLTIRAVGRLTYDETKLEDVTLKIKGWVAHLDVNATGQKVGKGQRLLTLFSPDLYAAQQEYLLAAVGGAASPTASLASATEKKLRLLGMTEGQIAQLKTRGTALEEMPILSPASGYVIVKDIVEGAAVEPGQRLYRIAALDQVWLEASLYEPDLAHVKIGQTAKVTLPSLQGTEVTGKVTFVYPYLDPLTRTGKARIQLPNKDLALKPDMYADVGIDVDLGQRLQIPASSVVYTGPRRIVFVDAGDSQLRPREIKTGARAGDLIEVTSGLAAGETIVVEGNFLVAAESRIRSSGSLWEDPNAGK